MASIAKFDTWQNTAGVNYQTVLQVVQRIGTAPYALAVTANTWATYPNSEMALTITPKFNTSKILLLASITIGSNVNQAAYRFTRGGAAIGVGDTAGTRPRVSAVTGYLNSADTNHTFRTISHNFLDSPATTSAITYNIDVMSEGATCHLNRSGAYTDSTPVYCGTAISHIHCLGDISIMSSLKSNGWETTAGSTNNRIISVNNRISTAPYAIGVTTNTWVNWPQNEMQIEVSPASPRSRFLLTASITVASSSNGNSVAFSRGQLLVGVGSQVTTYHPRIGAYSGMSYGATDGNHNFRTITLSYVDSPASIGRITYDIELMLEGGTMYLNRTSNFTDAGQVYNAIASSSFTIMEIE